MITIYNNIGKILANVEALSDVIETVIQNTIAEGNSYLYGYYESELYYIKDNLAILKPEKPTTKGEYDFDYSLKEWVRNLELEKLKIINQRNHFLQQSDWTDTVSAQTRLGEPLYLLWQIYRQALRDIPSQEGYPLSVTWPIAPD